MCKGDIQHSNSALSVYCHVFKNVFDIKFFRRNFVASPLLVP